MEVKECIPLLREVQPINFLFFRTDTKVNQLSNFLSVGQELFQEAVRHGLGITGPIHWHYFGFQGDESKTFTLEIALPVAEILNDYDGKFHFKRTDIFKCVSLVHEGAWTDLPKSYGTLMHFISENYFRPIAVNREIYINADFNNPDANITEIQIGIK